MEQQSKTILTGVKPTGTLHIGNYLGAVKPAIEFANKVSENDNHIMFVADYHAVNAIKTGYVYNPILIPASVGSLRAIFLSTAAL